MRDKWVPYNLSCKKFNSFSQTNFERTDNVVALRWKIGNSHQTRYYDIVGIFKWTFRKIYLGENPVTPEDRFIITPYQQSRIKKMYFSLPQREYESYSDFESCMRKEREEECEEEELIIPEDSSIRPHERYAELDRLISSTLISYDSNIARLNREIATSDRLLSGLERFNSESEIKLEWREWTEKQRQHVSEPDILRVSRRGMVKDREKAVKTFENTLNMYLETDRDMLDRVGLSWTGRIINVRGEFDFAEHGKFHFSPIEISLRLIPDM